jgi:hypothetical protein
MRFLSSGMLRSVDGQLVTDVSGQPIGPIFKGQAAQQEFLELFDPWRWDRQTVDNFDNY